MIKTAPSFQNYDLAFRNGQIDCAKRTQIATEIIMCKLINVQNSDDHFLIKSFISKKYNLANIQNYYFL